MDSFIDKRQSLHPNKRYVFWAAFALFLGFFVPFASFKSADIAYREFGGEGAEGQKQVVILKEQNNINTLQKNDIGAAGVIKAGLTENYGNVLNEKSFVNNSGPKNVSLVFVGDIMFDRGVKNSVMKNGDGDYAFLFQNANFLKNADISFGNLEGPISDKGEDLRNLYSFRFEPSAIKALKNSGLDVLSIANNHIGDWGKIAFEDTISRLDASGIIPVGGGQSLKDAGEVKVVEKNGFRIGFLAFSDMGPNWLEATEDSPGILIIKDSKFVTLVRHAASEVDILVVSLHFGEEYQKNANDRQKKLAHLAIENGAKIVVGHHPHVIQEVERYKNGIIAYSLGNFIFDQNFSKETMQGLALEIILSGTEIVSVKQNKIKINKFFQPQLMD